MNRGVWHRRSVVSVEDPDSEQIIIAGDDHIDLSGQGQGQRRFVIGITENSKTPGGG